MEVHFIVTSQIIDNQRNGLETQVNNLKDQMLKHMNNSIRVDSARN